MPFSVVALRLKRAQPYAAFDLALTETRVRAVFSRHPPLIGLPGRLGVPGHQVGSHPGPLSFYFLAPFYRLFGTDAGGLFAATLLINLAWIVVGIWIVWRRGSVRFIAWYGAAMLVLLVGLGFDTVDQPWNPYLPLMAWPVVLLAAWSVLCDDIVLLPVLVVAASYCMQTHVSYVALAGGIVLSTVVSWALLALLRRRVATSESGAFQHRLAWLTGPPDAVPSTRLVLKWVSVSAVVGVLAWLPPIVEQVRGGAARATCR